MIKRLIDFFTHKTLIARIEALEILAHPKCGIEGFDGYRPLVERIEKLENKDEGTTKE
jgi:hypothetical protein